MQPQQIPPIPEPATPPVPNVPFELPNSVTNAAPVPPTAPQQASDLPSDTPQMADDGDLIEKDWVNKIKQIVSSSSNNPYEQSRKFSALKADYMQKRYGKIIKSEE